MTSTPFDSTDRAPERTERLPTHSPAFWRNRVLTALATGKDLHTVVYDCSYPRWQEIQRRCGQEYARLMKPGETVLDFGCGYGASMEVAPSGTAWVGYDICPEMLDIGRIRQRMGRHRCESKFTSSGREDIANSVSLLSEHYSPFDWVVFRSVLGMMDKDGPSIDRDRLVRDLAPYVRKVLVIEYETSFVSSVMECVL